MAYKPLRPCRHPGCRELVQSGYCDRHKPKSAPRGESEQWHDLYNLPIWKYNLRPQQLLREPFCRVCWQERRERVTATEVDHIVPHRGRMELFVDERNLQSLCHNCHSAKTMRERQQRTSGKARKSF